MCQADGPGDGQPQSRATGRPAARSIGPVEPLEHVGKVLRGDPFSFVADGDAHLAIGRGRHRDSDPATCRGVPDRVVEQDHHELVKAIRVAANFYAARRFELEHLTGRQRLGGVHRF